MSCKRVEGNSLQILRTHEVAPHSAFHHSTSSPPTESNGENHVSFTLHKCKRIFVKISVKERELGYSLRYMHTKIQIKKYVRMYLVSPNYFVIVLQI